MQGAPGLSGASDDEGILVGQPADVCALSALAQARKRGVKLGGRRRKVIGVDTRGKKIYGEVVKGSASAHAKAVAVTQQRADARAVDIGPTIKALQAARRNVAARPCSRA